MSADIIDVTMAAAVVSAAAFLFGVYRGESRWRRNAGEVFRIESRGKLYKVLTDDDYDLIAEELAAAKDPFLRSFYLNGSVTAVGLPPSDWKKLYAEIEAIDDDGPNAGNRLEAAIADLRETIGRRALERRVVEDDEEDRL